MDTRLVQTINEQLFGIVAKLEKFRPIWLDICPNKSINQTLFATFCSIHLGADAHVNVLY